MRRHLPCVLLSIVLVAMLAACTSGPPSESPSSSPALPKSDPAPSAAGIQVTVQDPAVTPTVQVGTPPAAAAAALTWLGNDGVVAGQPIQITGDATAGATLTKRYETPIPDHSDVAFAYFDDDIGGWRVVPSTLSPDRLTLTAQVSHFSWWTDLASDLTFQVGKLFDTRVAAPNCQGQVPAWVDEASIVYLDDQNAPLRWCVGSDPAHPDILVVKVAINRGYGMVITPAVKPTWTWNSFLDQDPFQVAGSLFADADATISGTVSTLLSGGVMTPGGSELDFGFSETAVRANGQPYLALVTAGAPDPLQLAVSVLMKLLVEQSDSKDVAYAAAVLTATHCAVQLAKASSDWSEGASTLLDCVSGASEAITKGLAEYMAGSPKYAGMTESEIGKEAAKFFKFIKIVAAIGVGFQIGAWAGDATLVDAARTLSVGVTIAPPPSSTTAPQSTSGADETTVTTVSPIAADGSIKPEYTVVDQRPGLADCYQTRFISESTGVYRCGATADSLAACWLIGEGTMICMHDPDDTEVIRFVPDKILGPYTETDTVPRPWKMTLADGSVCTVRLGGSWDGRPDGLNGAYSCDGETSFVLVDATTVAVDRTDPTWTVLVGDLGMNVTDPPVKTAVARAILAGAAGS